MMKLYGSIVLALCIWLSLSGSCLAKEVYLQDGGIVECKSFWRKGNDVVVLINRDTIVELGVNELNMKKTFAKARKPRHAPKKSAAAAPAVAIAAAQKGATASRTAVPPTVAKSAPSPAAAPKPVPPVPAAQNKTGNTAPAEAPKPAAAPPKIAPAPPAAPAPVPASQPATRSDVSDSVPVAPAAPLDKEELERKREEAATMMAEALQKNDPELMKKAVELQKSTIQPEEHARSQVMGMKLVMITLVSALLVLISLWVVFEKAGSSGWKCLIPIYNLYVLMQIAGKPGWWAFLAFIPVVGAIFYLLAMLELAEKFGRGALFGIGLCLLPMFCFPLLAFGGARYEEQFGFA